jgi:hypothetical protein
MLSPITPAPITTVFGKVDETVTEEVMTGLPPPGSPGQVQWV